MLMNSAIVSSAAIQVSAIVPPPSVSISRDLASVCNGQCA